MRFCFLYHSCLCGSLPDTRRKNTQAKENTYQRAEQESSIQRNADISHPSRYFASNKFHAVREEPSPKGN